MTLQITASNRRQWREWLQKHHATKKEVWLVYYKKHTGKPSIGYLESVKEALCFGWIDGIKKRIDDERYMHRFTPRRSGSKWSAQNIRLARELIETGEMTETGRAVFAQRSSYDEKTLEAIRTKTITLTGELERALRTDPVAWDNFRQLAPGYRKQYVGWLQSAKRPETREKRLKQALKLLAKNKKLGMK